MNRHYRPFTLTPLAEGLRAPLACDALKARAYLAAKATELVQSATHGGVKFQVRPEKEIQRWLEGLAGKGNPTVSGSPYDAIRYDESELSKKIKGLVEHSFDERDSSDCQRAVREACRVLKSLIAPRFYSADENIGTSSDILRPDIILEDEISGAFVVIEIKRSKKAAREYATELLAYAEALSRQHKGAQVFFIVISASWSTLERHAFAKLVGWGVPCVALEYREECAGEDCQTLWVRSELLIEEDVLSFPPEALRVETKVFWLPDSWLNTNVVNLIVHAVSGLLREAEKTRMSGFVLVWWHPAEKPDQSQTRLYVSIAVRNSIRQQKIPDFESEDDAFELAMFNTSSELYDDTAIRLFLHLELVKDLQCYSSEYEGLWKDLKKRLHKEGANIFSFDAFGGIGDYIGDWRKLNRFALQPVVPDTTLLATWHPLTWLTPLESLINAENEDDSDSAVTAFRLGSELGALMQKSKQQAKLTVRNFGWGSAQASFAQVWSAKFAHQLDAPNLFADLGFNQLRVNGEAMEAAFRYACGQMALGGFESECCFVFGLKIAAGTGSNDFLERRSSELAMLGVSVPERVIRVARRYIMST
ncbi:hypothetical protein [Pseudomonas juntendi]|uniref:hypothetical protein n=1 Tax=Pseudomonas juntendi TaxID=2666183 RepID=UPI0032096F39